MTATVKNARKSTAAVVANVPAIATPEYDRADMLKRLASASAKERIVLLSALPMGEVAAIGGKVASIGSSVNEVLNIKMRERHGADWAALLKQTRADLSETDKERRKQVEASIESIRETVKANSGGDTAKARDTIRRVKEWGLGIRNSKSTPNANKKRGISEHLLSWDVLPSLYRRIQNDEGAGEYEMALGEAIAAYFKAASISPKAVLECKGQSDWNN